MSWLTRRKSKTTDSNPHKRHCDIPDCPGPGEHRAPMSKKNLRQYYWFCQDHARAYNQNWDFFEDMPRDEIERHMHAAITWDRPTWKPRQNPVPDADKIRKAVHEGFRFSDDAFFNIGDEADEESAKMPEMPSAELDALSVLNIDPPTDIDEIKAQYKKLVKKHHPDANGGDNRAEEMIKRINVAYGILKIAYERFSHLDER